MISRVLEWFQGRDWFTRTGRGNHQIGPGHQFETLFPWFDSRTELLRQSLRAVTTSIANGDGPCTCVLKVTQCFGAHLSSPKQENLFVVKAFEEFSASVVILAPRRGWKMTAELACDAAEKPGQKEAVNEVGGKSK